MAHPPRSNPSLRSSSGPPSPCITPSTETFVLVVSFMVAVPFSLVWSSFGRTVPQNLVHLLPPSISLPSMVLRDGWRGIHRKVDCVGRVLHGPRPADRGVRDVRAGAMRTSENTHSRRLGE